jgi:hypothetical protein
MQYTYNNVLLSPTLIRAVLIIYAFLSVTHYAQFLMQRTYKARQIVYNSRFVSYRPDTTCPPWTMTCNTDNELILCDDVMSIVTFHCTGRKRCFSHHWRCVTRKSSVGQGTSRDVRLVGSSIVCSETVYLTQVIVIPSYTSVASVRCEFLSRVWDKQSQNILC